MLKSFRPLAYLAAAALVGATGLGLASRQTVKAQGSVGTPSILEFRLAS